MYQWTGNHCKHGHGVWSDGPPSGCGSLWALMHRMGGGGEVRRVPLLFFQAVG